MCSSLSFLPLIQLRSKQLRNFLQTSLFIFFLTWLHHHMNVTLCMSNIINLIIRQIWMEYGTIKHQRQRRQEDRKSFSSENPPKNSLYSYKSATNESALIVIVCVLLFFTLDAGLLVRSQYSEAPATGHLNTGFSWFPCVYKQTLRRFPTFQVATTCFSCSPPDFNLVVTNFMFCLHVK